MKIHGTSQLAVTLMELLVVVAIIAVLALVGYSTFNRSKIEGRRLDASASLIATEAAIERYLTENNKKTFDSADLAIAQFANYAAGSVTPVLSKESYYRTTITTDSTGYIITATATVDNTLTSCDSSSNANLNQCKDLLCRKIIIDHGAKVSTNSAGVAANAATTLCW